MPSLPKPSDHQANGDDPRVPAVIYAAKSTDDPRGSIETQITDCEAMAARESWDVAGTYFDEAASAYHGNRGDGLAQARDHVARLATEHGKAVLVVQHSDRLSRGDGVSAAHLVEYVLWAMNTGVVIRSVQDDRSCESVLDAALMGLRNHEDSKRKSAATSAGRRRAAERGEWCGPVPDGYMWERTAQGSTIVRRVLKDSERIEVYTLLFDLRREGATTNDIGREFRRRGFRTAPRRGRPREFDATRINKALSNPFYAGLMVNRGETIGEGNWSPYIEPDDWHRLRQERSERARHRPNPVGRPAKGLLAQLARCECGGALIQQRYGPRKDGSRRRVYTCRTHMHGAGACSALPFDAEQVERIVLGGLEELLGDAGAWADALLSGRAAERARLMGLVEEAEREQKDSDRAIERLSARYAAAVEEKDDAEIALAKQAWTARHQTAERAALRRQAAVDALAAEVDEPKGDAEIALARMWAALSGELDEVKGETAALNAALRRWFERFELHRDADGRLRVVPILSIDAARELVRQQPPCSPPADDDGPRHQTRWSLFVPGNARHEEVERFEQVVGYVPMAPHGTGRPLPVDELADEPREGAQFRISVAAEVLTAETSGQPGKQRRSRLPHNTRPGSWRGTAGGSPRRNRRPPQAPVRS
jgi:site-specific DNA recombinase